MMTQSCYHSIVLGPPWLSTHDFVISWRQGELMTWGESCFIHCWSISCLSTHTESPATQGNVVLWCRELAEVFSNTQVAKLPPHQPWDCAIDLLLGATPPRGRDYQLSLPETHTKEDYIIEALANGQIHLSMSPAAIGFLFVEQKDRLQPCIDYQGLNAVMVKFRYTLPHVPSSIELIRRAKL